MISVREAKALICERCKPLIPRLIPLVEAGGFTLAEAHYAPIDQPPFDQSAMDGYAFAFSAWDGFSPLAVVGEVQAGTFYTGHPGPQEALRIFTGAALPSGMDTVVIQEKVSLSGDKINITDTQIKRGSNVRLRASQTRARDIALEAGCKLTPAAVAFLAGFGYDRVSVYPSPCIAIINTGKELTPPGQKLSPGTIFESNSYSLRAALQEWGVKPCAVEMVDDQETVIIEAIRRHLDKDIIILTGGVSVGDYDFVTSALESCGVTKVFHKVRQKPGKPLYFGYFQDTLVFGLPGNPASVLTCFYEYITEALSILTQRKCSQRMSLPLAADYIKKPGLTWFMKGQIQGDEVRILDDQESYKLNSFAQADCIIELDEEKEFFKK